MVVLVNRAKMTTATTGTGTITLGTAVQGYSSFATAGVSDGDQVRYVIEDGASNWEIGTGTYTASGTTLSRTVIESSAGGSAISLSGDAIVFISAIAADIQPTIYQETTATATGGQTTFSATYTVGLVEVFLNGAKLSGADFTATNGTQVVLASGATAGDIVDIVSYGTVSVANTYTQSAADAKFVDVAGDTMTGALTLPANPTSNLQAATKQYVDTIAAAGIHYHDPVRVEKEGALNATYNNGTSGVGATLTNAGTQEALVIDGVTMVVNDRVLIYEQTNAAHNGVYTVTNIGSGSTNWVLTRATDADSYGPSDPDALGQGDAFFVQEGDAGAGETYVLTTEGTITFGTTNLTFSQISATQIYSAGTNLQLSGTEFSTIASPSFTNITATGNITVGGTVDGRDIATNIPASLGTAGQVLSVNAGATAAEWADVSGGTSSGFVYFMRG